MKEFKAIPIETDVLIIGGGLAGGVAAIRARELNVDVTIVDKGFVSKSGDSSFTGGVIEVFNPEWGHDFDEWMSFTVRVGEYLVDRDWLEITRRDSYARYCDLVSWGVEFRRDKEDKLLQIRKGGPTVATMMLSRTLMPAVREKAEQSGGKILDRVMVTDLLKSDGRIVGAVGFHTRNGNFYTFKAKATIVACGDGHFKAASMPCAFSTGESYAMGYRAGAELTSMEFNGRRVGVPARCDSMATGLGILGLRVVNAKGDTFTNRYATEYEGKVSSHWLMSWAFEVHAGRGPIYYDLDALAPEKREFFYKAIDSGKTASVPQQLERSGIKMSGKLEMKLNMPHVAGHLGAGLRVINTGCGTTLPGLYVAGDSGGNNRCCATLLGTGGALQHCVVSGYRAGQSAAEYALKGGKPAIIDGKEIAMLKEVIYAPLSREGGFSPDYVTERLQQMILPYDILVVRHGKRLQAALMMVEYFRDHFVPKLWSNDIHDLVKVHETRSMVLLAEMILRSSLFRTESRGEYYREDYPYRDDENWLAWTVLKEEGDNMKLTKINMRKEWRPDAIPYKDRYNFFKYPVD